MGAKCPSIDADGAVLENLDISLKKVIAIIFFRVNFSKKNHLRRSRFRKIFLSY